MLEHEVGRRAPGGLAGRFLAQFGGPAGLLGSVAGWLMARRNGPTNEWMVELLDVRADDSVLDVGCGPGRGVEAAAAHATEGFVAGLDKSEVMVRQATGRNRAVIDRGRAEVRQGDALSMPYPDGRFTKAGTVNSVAFWPSAERGLAELRRVLAPGGRVAVVLRARRDGAGRFDRTRYGAPPELIDQLERLLQAAGFQEVHRLQRVCGGELHWALVAQR